MASVWLDTAGANALTVPVRLRFLSIADADRETPAALVNCKLNSASHSSAYGR